MYCQDMQFLPLNLSFIWKFFLLCPGFIHSVHYDRFHCSYNNYIVVVLSGQGYGVND